MSAKYFAQFLKSKILDHKKLGLATGLLLTNYYMENCKLDSKKESFIQQMYSWGYGNFGQLGLGNEQTKFVPTEVFSVDGGNVAQLETRKSVSALITKDGKVYTWGKNKYRVLGIISNDTNITLPTQVQELDNVNIVQISCGVTHMMALDSDGKVYSWGNTEHGKLGHSYEVEERKGSKTHYYTNSHLQIGAHPKQVEGLPENTKIVQISCGFQHSVLLSDKGEVFTLGLNKKGALGVETAKLENYQPVQVESLKNQKIVKIGTGLDFTLALNDKGQLFSWGNNNYGQLGNGTDVMSITPQKVQHGALKIQNISCGDYYSAALTQDGRIFTWGYGSDGQLCLKSKEDVYIPSYVNWSKKADQISCGSGHVAVISNGDLYMFGRGREGQLGLGDTISSETTYRTDPKQVVFFQKNQKVIQAKAGGEHTLALVQTAQ
ncbi:Regulator of chromosome condensation 1/beta-lactamase-inhibitor protein II [Pseudocohnilembus persalinus]|uniref:Regulator of chromosome condensation 1/beta-lactamase-inhibitor protein II n=1 Tax=Pseudocohnilembus persalinus TaxID=266149 RepID=A0A0V0QRM3_PSEPJ|nr:Regulator of chromosome condensation 1/beta-lactamase-inhibitor protein II [Pseudocohnilembus persalinus]|eukprot:KRX04844.1 Regulator of chromosome condensation 1/beta-lactamase-inhibitor protein II [Pseudocohnilembus persalinus]